jgi:adenosylcobinamide kinase/adenosylcobinamide-phosphate guanylyltransferase
VSRPRALLVLGGARAGKSAFALARAAERGQRVAFVATAEAGDAEMAARIARHRAARPPGWTTVEAPVAVVDALARLESEADVVVVDCLNLWVANLLGRRAAATDVELGGEVERLTAWMARRPVELVLVSNEVGSGVHPETPLGRRFRDLLGLANQAVAAAADEVVLLVAGCPLWLKVP